ncbi:MAG: hypothetical protein F6K63_10345 [Moorea sp. SIO1G6]|uniref:hypothetical protein n=1 Tax=unclassified Moorena TaxID=2683338 RepID=UPI0013BAC8CB|nr:MULTISPECIES: hypothetical protein [unclassified Moorena]NEQ11048.1 hypothetical protein [Moorena sp. SIO4E2]NET64764.1 hypothetical protein [Moorena sp. SIO1G6]
MRLTFGHATGLTFGHATRCSFGAAKRTQITRLAVDHAKSDGSKSPPKAIDLWSRFAMKRSFR